MQTEATKAPIPNAKYVISAGSSSNHLSVRSDGTFMQVLAQGDYVIEVHAEGFESTSKQVTVTSGVIAREEFMLTKEPERLPYHDAAMMRSELMNAKGSCIYAMHVKK